MLEYIDVTKSFGSRCAVDALSLTCPTASTTALIGPSGCGKTTLLRLAIGLLTPDRGEVRIGDRCVDGESVLALRRRIGYVIQEGGLFPHLDVRANVTLMADHLRWPRARIEDRFEALRQLVALPSDVTRRHPQALSGGQRQRVSLMRALMLDPDLLLLDEPLGSLDPLIRHDLQQELGELFRRLCKTVLLVTHDVAEAGTLADRIVLMRSGRIVQHGTLAELVERPVDPFVGAFLATQRGPREVLAEFRAAAERVAPSPDLAPRGPETRP